VKNKGTFYNCNLCDFEWHSKDGHACPICKKKGKGNPEKEFSYGDLNGRMFGTGLRGKRMGNIYSSIGLITLVYIIYALVKG